MVNKILSFAVLSLLAASPLLAQPLVLEQASNVVPAKTLEVGIDNLEYGSDLTKITDTDIELTRTNTVVPLIARYGFTNDIEGLLTIPYISLNSKVDSGGTSTTTSDAKLSDIQLAGKKSFMYKNWNMAAGLSLSLPTGGQSEDFPAEFKKGMNLTPLFAVGKGFKCPVTGKDMMMTANISYAMTGEYDGKNEVKYNPSDVLTVGVGVEHALQCGACSKKLSLGAELLYKSLSEQKAAGEAIEDSAGSQFDLVLGGRYYISENFKTKLGLALSLGDEKYREYDWKVLLGVTYLVKI